jgi:CPA1 family monovalent cation:H+ antiporter
MHLDLIIVILFSVATGVALAARWLKIPYTAALVIAGIALGAGRWVPVPHLSKDLLFAVFLPGLLFEAAFHIDAEKYWANKLAIHLLAVPGVVVAISLTAYFLTPMVQTFALEPGFRLLDGFVFGGIVAATDPIAVVSLFKSLGAPKRLGVLVEGESLLNDGTAVALFGVIFTLAMGSSVTVLAATLNFLRICGLGVAIGVALGYAGSKLIHLVDDPMIEITVTVVLAWGSFAIAEQLHASGVLATVSAGLLCGNHAARTGMSPTTKIAAVTFWAYVAFALNSIVFLLIGLEVELKQVLLAWKTVLIAWTVTTLVRAIVVATVSLLLRRSIERLPKWWATVICWGGIRGGLSMVLVLALPASFPHRHFLVNVVFGVVVVSILLQGMTMAPLLKRLKIVSAKEQRVDYEAARADLLAARAAIDELASFDQADSADAAMLASLVAAYQKRIELAEARIRALHLTDAALDREERHRVERHLIFVEKARILRAIREGLASEEAAANLIAELDARAVRLDEQVLHPPTDKPAADDDASPESKLVVANDPTAAPKDAER